MPFTVLCPACGSRFLLGDDLSRRQVAATVVAVRCRRCDAEVSLDARDIDTLTSQEAPQRRVPHPPRPKAKTELIAPLEPSAPPLQPVSEEEALETWDSDQTVSIAGKAPSQEAEFVDFEEIPASSSDAPPLDVLTHPARAVPPPKPNKRPDDFLVNLSAGTGGILSAPSLDAVSWTEPGLPSFEEVRLEPEPELDTQRAGSAPLAKATVPLFDMSAVLPAGNETENPGNSRAAPIPLEIDFGPARNSAPVPASKPRTRKFVVAPQPRAETQQKRGGVWLWLALGAGAAAALAFVGLHGQRATEHTTSEAAPDPTPVAATASAAVAVEPAMPAPEAPSVADVASAAASPSSAPTPAAIAPTSPPKNALPASAEPSAAPKPEPTVAAAAPSAPPTDTAKPDLPKAPITIHNAPPPAAPGTEFDRAAAVAALNGAAQQASSCRKEGDPSGTAVLTITFAPSGRVTSAAIQGPPFAGTATGGCIASTMRHASIPAFEGERVTVTKTVVIE